MNQNTLQALAVLQSLGQRRGQQLQQMGEMQAMPFQEQLLQNQVDAPRRQERQFRQGQDLQREGMTQSGNQFAAAQELSREQMGQSAGQFDRTHGLAERELQNRGEQNMVQNQMGAQRNNIDMSQLKMSQDLAALQALMEMSKTMYGTYNPDAVTGFMKDRFGMDYTGAFPKQDANSDWQKMMAKMNQ